MDDSDTGARGAVGSQAVDQWFVEQVLPLEPALMRLLRRYWRSADDVADLRQEVYTRVYEGALRDGMPEATGRSVPLRP